MSHTPEPTPATVSRLGDARAGQQLYRVERIDLGPDTRALAVELERRLMELGFVPGSIVTVVHEAPFGADPIAVRVRGSLLALRRQEAQAIRVQAIVEPTQSSGVRP